MNNKLVLIDAMALTYKAYFAFINRPLKTRSGEPTSAVFGFLSQFFKIMEISQPDYIAIAFDSKEKTFRHEKFDFYKANRQEMPDDMIPQIKRIKEIITLLNIPQYIFPGFEADDIIGSAACFAAKNNLETYVFTPDKDFIQLISDNINIVRPGKPGTDDIVIWNRKTVLDKLGFEPPYMIDYLALIGDSSDNIPGVKGIGEKTAIPLIQQFGTIEEILNNIENIKSASVKKKLEEGKESALISKELATINCEVNLDIKIEDLIIKEPDFEGLQSIFSELEFKNHFQRLLNIYKKDQSEVVTVEAAEENNEVLVYDKDKVKYKLITTIEDAKKLAATLSKSEIFTFDTETDGLKLYTLNLAGVSFCLKENEAYFIAIDPFLKSDDLFAKDLGNRLKVDDFIKIFKGIFENNKIKKICQNAKFDIAVLKNYGINVKNLYFDTMLASYLIDPDEKHNMDDLSQKYLGYRPIPLTELIGKKKDATKIFDVPPETLSCYSCEDSDITYRLFNIFENKVKEDHLEKVAYEIEFPLVYVLEDMERTGIKVDREILRILSNDLQILIDNYSRSIFECCDETFNLNSPLQLQRILFDKLGLSKGKKTKTGFSTDAKSLENLKGEHQVIDLLLNYREVAKLKSTYADALPNMINPKTGRIHSSFNQTTAVTGRLSSLDPNLQNIPIRTELGKEIRKAFIPKSDDYVILSADYSQIELRILAALCQDKKMLEAFSNKEDIHRSTAALVFNVKKEEVTPEMRRRAKEVNFGILYGIGPFGLKTRLGISQFHAKEVIDNYFAKFSSVKSFIDECIEKAQITGFAETITGRRRYLRNINSKNKTVKQFEERVAVNMPIQGTAADMIKIAMINIFNEFNKRNYKSKMLLQVHDELVFDAHKDELTEITPLIKNIMETALPLEVPILVEVGTGDNWLDAH